MADKRLGIFLDKSSSRTAWSMSSLHSHKSHELYFLISGQRRYFVGHSIYDLAPGNLVFIPGGTLHRTIAPGHTGYERYVVNFFETQLNGFIDRIGRTAFDRLLHCGCLELPPDITRRVRQDLGSLDDALKTKEPYTNAAAVHLLEDILLCALRHGTPAPPCAGETADKVQQVARYISKNYTEPLTLHDAARLAGLEETYFSRRFKILTGFGFHEYLTQTRLLAAEHLLEKSDLSMVDIAEHCGFSNSNYFGDVFRRWKGVSPSQYRKQLKQEP